MTVSLHDRSVEYMGGNDVRCGEVMIDCTYSEKDPLLSKLME